MKKKNKKPLGGKRFVGEVVSDKMTGTVVVLWEKRRPHPFYRKLIVKKKKFYADNKIGAKMGDLVEIAETRPLSKLKRFVVINIIKNN